MADHRPLTIQNGKPTKLAVADATEVGTGILSSGVGNLNLRSGGSSIDVQAGKHLTALAGAGNLDWSASSGLTKTGTGAVSINGDTTLAAGKNISVAAGASAVDFSGGTGLFKTTTGAVTIGGSGGTMTVSSTSSSFTNGATFAGAGTGLTVNNNALISGTLDSNTIDRVGTMSIGAGSATSITIGRVGQLVTFAGNVQVDGTEVVVGGTTFQGAVIFEGNVTFGNAVTDTVAFTARLTGNLNALKEANHSILIDASDAGETIAGGNWTIQSGAGSAASGATAAAAGGSVLCQGGTGGAASTTAGGDAGLGAPVTCLGGTGGAGAGTANNPGEQGGSVLCQGGTGGAGGATFLAGAGGDVLLTAGVAGAAGGGAGAAGGSIDIEAGTPTGSGAEGTITIGGSTASAIGIGKSGTTTTITGRLDQLTGALNLTANAASQLTTSSGALTVTAAAASTWKTSGGLLTIEGAAGVRLNGAAGTPYLKIGETASVIEIQSGITLQVTGTGMIDLPLLFEINNVAVGATVTSANLNTLTNGSNADALHTHSGVTANQLIIAGLTTTGLADGDAGYVSAADVMTKTDADAEASSVFFGFNEGTAGSMTVAGIVESAKFTTIGGSPSNGARVYLARGTDEASASGKLTADVSGYGTGDFISEVGICLSNANYAGAKTCKVLLQPKAVVTL